MNSNTQNNFSTELISAEALHSQRTPIGINQPLPELLCKIISFLPLGKSLAALCTVNKRFRDCVKGNFSRYFSSQKSILKDLPKKEEEYKISESIYEYLSDSKCSVQNQQELVSYLAYNKRLPKDLEEASKLLFEVCKEGKGGMVEWLLIIVDPNIRDNQQNTPLHYAYLSGYHKIADLLIKKGSDIKAENLKKQTPLDYKKLYTVHKESKEAKEGTDNNLPSRVEALESAYFQFLVYKKQ